MLRKSTLPIVLATLLFTVSSSVSLYAQSQAGCVQVSSITIETLVPLTTLGTIKVLLIDLVVVYPVGLSSNAYISSTQLSTDMLSLVATYPTPNDPLTIMVPALLSSLLKKYPQMSAVEMSADSADPASPTSISATVYPTPAPITPIQGSSIVGIQPQLTPFGDHLSSKVRQRLVVKPVQE